MIVFLQTFVIVVDLMQSIFRERRRKVLIRIQIQFCFSQFQVEIHQNMYRD